MCPQVHPHVCWGITVYSCPIDGVLTTSWLVKSPALPHLSLGGEVGHIIDRCIKHINLTSPSAHTLTSRREKFKTKQINKQDLQCVPNTEVLHVKNSSYYITHEFIDSPAEHITQTLAPLTRPCSRLGFVYSISCSFLQGIHITTQKTDTTGRPECTCAYGRAQV